MTNIKGANQNSLLRFIGCCGAYCKTCKVFIGGFCKGCKLGYDNGTRDINKAKCSLKICCFKEKVLETCIDCIDYPICKRIHAFYSKKGFKYKKYKQSVEFISKNGYHQFIKRANGWNDAFGKLG